jgi:hypothetical protein
VDALIESIMQLYRQISERLLQVRIDRSEWHSGPAPNIDIAEPLIARVRAYAAENMGQRQEQRLPTETAYRTFAPSHVSGEDNTSLPGASPPDDERPLLPSELAEHFAKEPRTGALLPPVGQQLKRRTFEYVNHALELAKQGDAESAETYAKLAECALRTAADYLSAEEYRTFANEVVSRVHPTDETSG